MQYALEFTCRPLAGVSFRQGPWQEAVVGNAPICVAFFLVTAGTESTPAATAQAFACLTIV
ncbi:hypothetical protein AC20117_21975 [Arthrobacter crystallopoietes]|nr:hypothetical protein AC20117_00100 [Arthrobacter crystallopoietes]AUI53059.1 hypothetical protein AC20117_21975 [Arthrobacter crystallopoietes]